MTYKINFKNQIKNLQNMIFGSFMYSFLCYFLLSLEAYNIGLILFLIAFYLILLLPTLYLHIEYYKKNKDNIFIINSLEKNIIIDGIKINFESIKSIEYYMPRNWHLDFTGRMYPTEDYHFAKIRMFNRNDFIFTSLLSFSVEKTLKEITGPKIEKHIIFFATLSSCID